MEQAIAHSVSRTTCSFPPLQRSFTCSIYRFLPSIAAADTASTSRVSCSAGDFAPSGPEQDQSSYQLIFFPDLPAQAVYFEFLRWTNFEATCCWPATVGAKRGGLRELKTTVQTLFGHRCPPLLSSALDAGSVVGCSPSIPRLLSNSPLVCSGVLPLTKRIEYASHSSVTATQYTFTTTSHFLCAGSGPRCLLPGIHSGSGLFLWPHDQHWQPGRAQHTLGHTPYHPVLQSAPAMR